MPPPAPGASENNASPRRAEAAAWIVARERGLTPEQARKFERWLAADPRHAAALQEAEGVWRVLDGIPAQMAEPVVERSLKQRGRFASADVRRFWPVAALGGLAASVLAMFLFTNEPVPAMPSAEPVVATRSIADAPHTRTLADGTRVRLNVGAEIAEQFSASERRLQLVRGEAYFMVKSDPARPFVVHAGAVTVRAVGTAFNVRWQPQAVDVLVTEGRVEVRSPGQAAAPVGAAASEVAAGQRALVEVGAVAAGADIRISSVTPADLAAALAWHEPLRKLGMTLVEFAADFERQTGRRVVVADDSLRGLEIGGRFPADDFEELLRLLSETYGIAAERLADGTVVLRRAR